MGRMTGDGERGAGRPTLRQVAAASGVHPSTASRVLNGDPTLNVPVATRARVEEAARTLGYRVNVLARGLRLKQTFALGLLIPDISDPVFGLLFRGAEEAAEERRYQVLLSNTDDDPGVQERRVEMLLGRNVDGLILTTALRQDPAVEELAARGVPYVLLNRRTESSHSLYIVSDDLRGAYLATKHLIEQGHERIAHLAGPQNTTTAHLRLAGYKKALAEAGIAFDPELVGSTHFREEAGEAGMRELMRLSRLPAAVFAVNDLTAIGAITVIRARGLSVPGDIAVVGYNDIPLASKFEPSLTSVRTPLTEMGRAAAQMLIGLLSGERKQESRTFEPRLIERTSSIRAR